MKKTNPVITESRVKETKDLLMSYRITKESVKIAKIDQAGSMFCSNKEYKASMKHILKMYHPENSFKNLTIPLRDDSVARASEMIDLIDDAVSYIYANFHNGHLYGYILKYSYLNTVRLSTPEIVGILNSKGLDVDIRTFNKEREDAIEALTAVLFSYALCKFDSLFPWINKEQ